MIVQAYTATLMGIEATEVSVEVRIRKGKRIFSIIGLPDSAVREARDRVEVALSHLGVSLECQVLVNLSPAEVKKEGAGFDLAIAVGILAALGKIPRAPLKDTLFHGELGLDGTVRPVRGSLACALNSDRRRIQFMMLAPAGAEEAALAPGISIVRCGSIRQALEWLRSSDRTALAERIRPNQVEVESSAFEPDRLEEVRGQDGAKRALEIAAAGGHHLLMIGPPGCGKSMLAERLGGLLPILDNDEKIEVAKIYSAAGLAVKHILRGARPYRAPHHSVSEAGLIGGGVVPRPGEISLAHAGVLFLDELPEFKRGVLESLRAPLEMGMVTISRARGHSTIPARIQLVAAMNPCPCGRLGSSSRGAQACMCARPAIENYLKRVSQPILDRIDLQVELHPVSMAMLFKDTARVTSPKNEDVHQTASSRQKAVADARARQIARQGKLNSHMRAEEIRSQLPLEREAERILEQGGHRLGLSARGVVRCLRVAATIADLSLQDRIGASQVAEALQYRALSVIDRYLRVEDGEKLTAPRLGV